MQDKFGGTLVWWIAYCSKQVGRIGKLKFHKFIWFTNSTNLSPAEFSPFMVYTKFYAINKLLYKLCMCLSHYAIIIATGSVIMPL